MNRLLRFLYDDNGMELLQWAIVLVIAIAIGATVVELGKSARNAILDVKNEYE